MDLRDRFEGALLGHLVGDALGVPVEFLPRERLAADPVTGMRGHGTHDQPAGTWSDDGSMTLTTCASLLANGWDLRDQIHGFHRWFEEAWWTPHGRVFDIGGTTRGAVARYKAGADPRECGGYAERNNGNGSLMRIMPVSLWLRDADAEVARARTEEASALTHAHPRSTLTCVMHTFLVRALLAGATLEQAVTGAGATVRAVVPEEDLPHMERLLSGAVLRASEGEIRGSGYVIHCLEAALWCLHHEPTFAGAVLRAVNLGEDTDTTGAVTGALAGLIHGRSGIPADWVDALARRDEVIALIEGFVDRLLVAD